MYCVAIQAITGSARHLPVRARVQQRQPVHQLVQARHQLVRVQQRVPVQVPVQRQLYKLWQNLIIHH